MRPLAGPIGGSGEMHRFAGAQSRRQAGIGNTALIDGVEPVNGVSLVEIHLGPHHNRRSHVAAERQSRHVSFARSP